MSDASISTLRDLGPDLDWRTRRRFIRQANLLRSSGLFDAAWYRAQCPDCPSTADPALHYLLRGAREGFDPGPAFNGESYYAANPDVAASGLNPLAHYLTDGRGEGRALSPRDGVPASRGAPARWRTLVARLLLSPVPRAIARAVLRPRRELRTSLPEGYGDTASLSPARGRAPTGWTLLRLPQKSAAARLALRVLTEGSYRELDLPAASADRPWTLVRLPDLPARLGLGCGLRGGIADIRGGTQGLIPAGLTLREIGRVEALARLLALHGWPWSALVGAARRGPGALVATLQALAATHAPHEVSGYQHWVDLYDTPSRAEFLTMRARARAMTRGPRFSVIVPTFDTPSVPLREMIGSVRGQVYPHWELCIADDASTAPHVREILRAAAAEDPRIRLCLRERNGNIAAASNSAIELAGGDYVALLDHDDVLPPHALLTMADAIAANPRADLLFSDEDKLDAEGRRHDPYFKPDYSPELLHGQNFISHLGVYRLAALRAAGGFREGFEGSQDYDLALRVIGRSRAPIVHVPHILYHWRLYPGAATFSSTQTPRATLAARRAIHEAAATRGDNVEVVDGVGHYHRVLHAPPTKWPMVSAIVPTRDHVGVLRECIDGLLDQTDYPALEILIIDNDSAEPQTHEYLAGLAARGVRVLAFPGSFNYSAINNFAARHAVGEVLLLLNSDVSMLDRGWLAEMVRQLLRPGVGAVGARLLYPDTTVQHAGVVIGLGGVAGHTHVGAERDDPGYFGQLLMTREASAVTGACMAVRRACYRQVGGLDEDNLPVAFNDVDFCLRLREAGWRVVWTPHAELLHHESKSRGSDFTPERVEKFHAEVAYMRRRWGAMLQADPFYNPNLSLDHSRPTPAFPPRLPRPWAHAALPAEAARSSHAPEKAAALSPW